MAGEIGQVRSVDFHWYLDTSHGADYFRRWHRLKEKSGSLWVHKATHHFDLVNWWLAADPVRVQAFGELKRYGKAGPFRSTNCRPCPHKTDCQFHCDITRGRGNAIYTQAEDADGYLRDGCVFREDVSSWDTMTATIKYSNDVIMSYSLNMLHADRGLRARLQRRQRPPRDPRLRTPAVPGGRRDRDLAVQELRPAHAGRDSEGRRRPRRRRRRAARADLPWRRQRARAPEGARLARRRDVVPDGHRGTPQLRRGASGGHREPLED